MQSLVLSPIWFGYGDMANPAEQGEIAKLIISKMTIYVQNL